MTNDIPLPSSTIDLNAEKATLSDYQSLIQENEPATSTSQNHHQKSSSSYLTLPVGDNQCFGLSNFQDPLFYQQPLHFHYNQPIISTIGSGYETGDRTRLTNDIKFNEYRKQNSISSRKHRIEKNKSTHRRSVNSKKSKDKIIKAKAKNKKRSTASINKRKHKNKKVNQNHIQQLRHQSKRRRQEQILSKKKKKLLKQRVASKKDSKSKINKKKSLTSTQHNQKLNMNNNRILSTISSRRSLVSNFPRTRSITQVKAETTVIKQQPPTPSNTLSSSCVRSTILPKVSSNTKLEQNLSKKSLLRSRLNVRKHVTSKSKQIKQRNRASAKLNIHSPIHATFKKNVRYYHKRRSTGCKTKSPRCTSKTLIRIAPMNINDENIHTRTSPSLFSLKNNLNDKLSSTSTSTVMPLTKNSAQLTSKNNNKILSNRGNNSIPKRLGRELIKSTRRGMTLRSRTIIINNVNSTKRKLKKYK